MAVLSYFIYGFDDSSKLNELAKVLLPSIATLFTALVAIAIFRCQQVAERTLNEAAKKEEKERLAATIYKEIKSAQIAIEKIKQENLEKEQQFGANSIPAIGEFSPPILPYESWTKNKHLFLRELGSEHYDVIDNSFNAAIQAEDCRKWAIDLFRVQATQKGIAKVDAVIQISKDLVIEQYKVEKGASAYPALIEEGLVPIKRKCEASLENLISDPNFLFKPKELGDRGNQALEKFKPIINTPAGERLKQLCGEFSL